jgi:hypothetical protein
MSKTHLIIPDQHSHPSFNNDRADWIGKLILDLKPDVVVNMGDAADMASLSLYDKNKASFHSRNYSKDIEAHLDFQDRLWRPLQRAKKRWPYAVVLEGNHENRIKRALDLEPHLKGEGGRFGISFNDLDFETYYHEIVEYEGQTPGTIHIDGIAYAHYFISGIMGRAVSGEHHASSLIDKNHMSSTCAHSHLIDFSVRTKNGGQKLMGLVAGACQDYRAPWAGASNDLWWSGVVVKRNVENGVYDPQFISLDALRKEYGSTKT